MSLVTIPEIFDIVSDSEALMLFRAIASGDPNEVNKCKKKMTSKQYYLKISSLLKVNLIRKRKGEYYLTNLGKIFHYANMNLEVAMENFWKLKAIDILEESDRMPGDELSTIISRIIDNNQVKELLTGEHWIEVKFIDSTVTFFRTTINKTKVT
jgi:hypothetical protein